MSKSIKMKNNIYWDTTSIHREIISVGLTSLEEDVKTEKFTIPFDSSVAIGEKLQLVNGKIKIGKGIKRVLVSGTAFIDTPKSENYLWLFITKNDNNIASSLTAGGMVYKSSSITPRLIDVKEGDLIGMLIDTTAGTPYNIRSEHSTYMTVQVVE